VLFGGCFSILWFPRSALDLLRSTGLKVSNFVSAALEVEIVYGFFFKNLVVVELGLLRSVSLGTRFIGPEKVVMLLCFVARLVLEYVCVSG